MAFALSLSSSVALQRLPSSSSAECVSLGHSRPTNFLLPRRLLHPSTLTLARRRHNNPAVTSTASPPSKRKKSNKAKKNVGNDGNDGMEEDLEGDPLEALFSILAEDLKNDGSATEGGDDDDEITEEDIDRLASELEEALGDFEMGAIDSTSNDAADDAGEDDDNDEEEDEGEDDDEEEEERPVKLKNWQLRRLAYALKVGRRKTNIKSLAADLCLDRAVVLELLRDPPPNLILMSANLPDEPTPTVPVSETKPIESEKITVEAVKPERKVKEPIHVMQRRWSAQKRLKKVQVETLERVYRRSKRPTNAMISSIVHVTNLPHKRVLKWFEDRRSEDEIPSHRLPYERSVPGTVSSQ
ncbi:hypothetical protein SLE2022_270910 [Rubroshorea leprosula]